MAIVGDLGREIASTKTDVEGLVTGPSYERTRRHQGTDAVSERRFLVFFDSVAFADNPDWSDCYCSAYENPFQS